MVCYLPKQNLRQFRYMQTISTHPIVFILSTMTRNQVNLEHAQYFDHIFTC